MKKGPGWSSLKRRSSAKIPPTKKKKMTEARNITPTRLWSRVFSQDSTVVPSCRYVGAGGVPASAWLSASDRRIRGSFRRSDTDRVALQRLDVLDEGGDLRPGQLALETGHHRLEALHDLLRRIHHRLREVRLVRLDGGAVGQLLAAVVEVEPGGTDVPGAVRGVALDAALLGGDAPALIDHVSQGGREVERRRLAVLGGHHAAMLEGEPVLEILRLEDGDLAAHDRMAGAAILGAEDLVSPGRGGVE